MNRTVARHLLLTAVLCGACDGSVEFIQRPPDPCTVTAGRLTDDLVLPSNCRTLRIVDDLVVQDGHTLTIPPGSSLMFDPGASLIIGEGSAGKLIALGLPDAPIRFFGVPDPEGFGGGWGGVFFAGATLPSSVLANVIIDGGGREDPTNPRGCLTVKNVKDNALILNDLSLVGCAGVGLVLDAGRVGPIDNLQISDTEVGVRVAPSNVVDLPDDIDFQGVAANVLIGCNIDTDTQIRPLVVPWRVDGDLSVGGPLDPTLTIAAGTVLRFEAGRWLSVGHEESGSLLVQGTEGAKVTMTARSLTNPWHGIVLGPKTARASLDRLVLRFGGAEGLGVRGCLSIGAGPSSEISLVGVEISDCIGAGIGATDNADFAFGTIEDTMIARAPVGWMLGAQTVGSAQAGLAFEEVERNVILGGTVRTDATWSDSSIPWRVQNDVGVRGANSPHLTIDAGVVLEFAAGRWLSIGTGEPGALIVRGNPEERAIFRPVDEGAWRGIVLGPAVLEGTTIDYADISGGGEAGPNVGGCLSVTTPLPGRVSVTNTNFDACRQSAVSARADGFRFATFEDNVLSEGTIGLSVAPSVVASIATSNRYPMTGANVIYGGRIEDSGSWVAGELPWHVVGPVHVDGPNEPELTLSPGLQLRFEPDGGLLVGMELGGALVATGTTAARVGLTSAQEEPAPGDWLGVRFGRACRPSTLTQTRVTFAQTGVALSETAANVSITDSGFGSNTTADIYVDCESQPRLSNNNYGSPAGLVRQTGCR